MLKGRQVVAAPSGRTHSRLRQLLGHSTDYLQEASKPTRISNIEQQCNTLVVYKLSVFDLCKAFEFFECSFTARLIRRHPLGMFRDAEIVKY